MGNKFKCASCFGVLYGTLCPIRRKKAKKSRKRTSEIPITINKIKCQDKSTAKSDHNDKNGGNQIVEMKTSECAIKTLVLTILFINSMDSDGGVQESKVTRKLAGMRELLQRCLFFLIVQRRPFFVIHVAKVLLAAFNFHTAIQTISDDIANIIFENIEVDGS